jgi:hypothetical protein
VQKRIIPNLNNTTLTTLFCTFAYLSHEFYLTVLYKHYRSIKRWITLEGMMLQRYKSFLLLTAAFLTGCGSIPEKDNRLSEEEIRQNQKQELEKQRFAELALQLEDRLSSENANNLGKILTESLNEFTVRGIPIFHIYPSERTILESLFHECLKTADVKEAVVQGSKHIVVDKLLDAIKSIDNEKVIFSLTSSDKFVTDSHTGNFINPQGDRLLNPYLMRFVRLKIGDVDLHAAQTAEGKITRFGDKWQVEFYNKTAMAR